MAAPSQFLGHIAKAQGKDRRKEGREGGNAPLNLHDMTGNMIGSKFKNQMINSDILHF